MNPSIKLSASILTLALLFGLSILSNSLFAQTGGGSSVEDLDETGFIGYNDCELTDDCPESSTNSSDIVDAGVLPSIQLSPNPTVGNLMKIGYRQLMGSSQLSVLDLSGKIIHRTMIGSEREKEGVYTVNTSTLSPGVYIVHLQSGLYKAVQKVIIRN